MKFPLILVALTVFAILRTAACAQEVEVDLELVLAVDVSSSIEGDEQFLQRQGYITAFQSPRLVDAIRSGPLGRIAVAYVEWGDPESQRVVVPWTLVDDRLSAMAVAYRLAEEPINRFFGTSIAGAIGYSGALLAANGFSAERRVIDLSANGPNNMGSPVAPARDAIVEHGITINGLPIMIHLDCCEGLYSTEGLDLYFEDCVIGGPGAFVIPIRSRDEIADTIGRKLLLEIVGPRSETLQQISFVDRQRLDCAAIEKSPGRILPLKPGERRKF